MGDTGLERTPPALPKTPISQERGTESDTVDVKRPLNPDSAKIVITWPTLPEHFRAAIKALIDAHCL